MAGVPSLMVEEAEQKTERDKKSLLELMLSTVDKSEQFTREAARQVFLEHNQPFYTKPFEEIFQGKRQEGEERYTSEEFRQDLYEKFGLKSLSDAEEGLSSGGKLAADLATDLVFNADNLLFGLPGKVVGKAGGIAADALKSANITEKSKVLKALSNLDPKTIGRTTTGAVLGATMAQEDDEASDLIKKTFLGAAAGMMFSPGAGKLLEGISKFGDNTIDAFNRGLRPDFYRAQTKLLGDIPLAERTGLGTDVGIKDVVKVAGRKEREMMQKAHFYRKELESLESGLTDDQLQIIDQLRPQAAGMSKKYRDAYYKGLKKKLTANGNKLNKPAKQALLSEATRRANSIVGKKMIPIIHAADPTGKVVKYMDDFVAFNRRKMDEYNKAIPDHKNPYTVGFDYYMPSIVDDLGAPAETLVRAKGGFKRVRSTDAPDLSELSRGQVRDMAAQRYSHAFLNGQERTARMLLTSLNNTPMTMRGGKYIDAALDTFDRFNRFIVAGQLFAQTAWIQTNYLDNLGRAFMVGGLGTALKAAVGGGLGLAHGAARVAVENGLTDAVRKQLEKIPLAKPTIDLSAKMLDKLSRSTLMGEILESTHPSANGKGVYDHDILELANITGVIDTAKARQFLEHWNQFGGIRTTIKGQDNSSKLLGLIDDAVANSSGNVAEAALKTARLGGKAVNKTTGAINSILSQSIARIGTANEAYTRIKTFEHVYKTMLEEVAPGAYSQMKKAGLANSYQQGIHKGVADKATQIVEDTFFDYSKVTMFEKAVAKRTIPYWTFYSRNAHFWIKSITDPEKVGQALKNIRAFQSIGREPTKADRDFVSPYVLKEGARVLDRKTPDGRLAAVHIPGASAFEALNDAAGLAAIAGKITGVWPEGISAERIKATEKISPVIKPAIEMWLGKELFTDKPLLPSDSDEGRRRVFSDALATKWLFDGPLAMVPYKTKIYIDHDGKDYFIEDDTDALVITLRRNWLPHLRIVEKILGSKHDIKSGKRTKLEAGIHYWTPFSVKPYTLEDQVKGIKRTIKKEKRRSKIKQNMQEFNLEELND